MSLRGAKLMWRAQQNPHKHWWLRGFWNVCIRLSLWEFFASEKAWFYGVFSTFCYLWFICVEQPTTSYYYTHIWKYNRFYTIENRAKFVLFKRILTDNCTFLIGVQTLKNGVQIFNGGVQNRSVGCIVSKLTEDAILVLKFWYNAEPQ